MKVTIEKKDKPVFFVGLGDIVIGKDSGNPYMVVQDGGDKFKYRLINLQTATIISGSGKEISDIIQGMAMEREFFTKDQIELILKSSL